MTHERGGFFSSQDADSEGHEGKYYVWSADEIRAVLDNETLKVSGVSENAAQSVLLREDNSPNLQLKPLGSDYQIFFDRFGVTAQGNFEGVNILAIAWDIDVVAATHHLSVDETRRRLDAARQKLFARRESRVKPARDEKVLTAWNGLMLAAFAEAARVMNRDDYRAIAERNADFILRELRPSTAPLHGSAQDARLLRSWNASRGVAKLNAYLEDYANLIEGLLALYETTFDARWFIAARELADTMLAHFADPSTGSGQVPRGGFFDTSDDHETLLVRPKSLDDNAVPSGNAMATTVLLKLAALTGDQRYSDAAERALKTVQRALTAAPIGFAQWLSALDFALSQPKEIAIVGDTTSARALLDVVFEAYRPNQVIAVGNVDSPIPLLQNRTMLNGKATAYVCQNFACQLPVTEPADLLKQLEE